MSDDLENPAILTQKAKRPGFWWLKYLPFGLVLILLLPGSGGFPFPSNAAQYSDLATTHYPNAVFLRQSLLIEKQIPLWSPLIFSGYPFYAHPLSGLWYPPGWLALIFPLPLGFNLLVVMHLLWGAWGMVKFLQSRGLSQAAVWFGALGFALMPKYFAHYGAGHLTLLYAVSWLPWLLWAATATPRRSFWLCSLIWALTFLADVRWGVYAGLVWVAYSLFQGWRVEGANGWQRLSLPVGRLALQGVVAFGLAAPLVLPLVELTGLTSRTNLALEDFTAYSLPLERLLFGFLFPDFGGFHEWVLYSGALVFLLALASILVWKHTSETRFWMWIFILSSLFALGENLPGIAWLAQLPGISLLRVPARAMFLTQFSMLVLASQAVHALQAELSLASQKRLNILTFSLVVLVLLMCLGLLIVTKHVPVNFIWGGSILLVGMVWIIVGLQKAAQSPAWIARLGYGIILICLLDWFVVDRSLFVIKPAAQVLETQAVAQYLSLQPGDFRLYSPSYSLPQQTAVHYWLEFASGVDPVQLQSYVAFMQAASSVPASGYSVTIPPFASGNPQVDNRAYRPRADLLGLLNVRYILSAFPLEAAGLETLFVQDGVHVYQNQLARARAWVEQGGEFSDQDAFIVHRSPNQLTVLAQGPGLLVLSELVYPGWQATINGEAVPIQVYQGLLRSVSLSEGTHLIEFVFRPASLFLGLTVFLLTVAATIAYSIVKRKDGADGYA